MVLPTAALAFGQSAGRRRISVGRPRRFLGSCCAEGDSNRLVDVLLVEATFIFESLEHLRGGGSLEFGVFFGQSFLEFPLALLRFSGMLFEGDVIFLNSSSSAFSMWAPTRDFMLKLACSRFGAGAVHYCEYPEPFASTLLHTHRIFAYSPGFIGGLL